MYRIAAEFVNTVVFSTANKSAVRRFEVLESDRFVRCGPNLYQPTTSISCADYLIPDWMMVYIPTTEIH